MYKLFSILTSAVYNSWTVGLLTQWSLCQDKMVKMTVIQLKMDDLIMQKSDFC